MFKLTEFWSARISVPHGSKNLTKVKYLSSKVHLKIHYILIVINFNNFYCQIFNDESNIISKTSLFLVFSKFETDDYFKTNKWLLSFNMDVDKPKKHVILLRLNEKRKKVQNSMKCCLLQSEDKSVWDTCRSVYESSSDLVAQLQM